MLCLYCILPFEIVYFRVTEVMMVMVIACVIIIELMSIVINMMMILHIRHKMSAILVGHSKETN